MRTGQLGSATVFFFLSIKFFSVSHQERFSFSIEKKK